MSRLGFRSCLLYVSISSQPFGLVLWWDESGESYGQDDSFLSDVFNVPRCQVYFLSRSDKFFNILQVIDTIALLHKLAIIFTFYDIYF